MTWVFTHLVAKTLRGNDGDFIADSLVGLKVESELGVVSLNDDLGRLLDGLDCDKLAFVQDFSFLIVLSRDYHRPSCERDPS